jgi:hypothetical protein
MTKIIEIDCETGESVERDMTSIELEAQVKIQEELDAQRIASESEYNRVLEIKASAKSKLVAGIPLTPEEADMLVI